MKTLEDREFVERFMEVLPADSAMIRLCTLAMRGVELEGWAAKRNQVAGDPHEVLSAEVNLLRADAERLREALRVAVELLEEAVCECGIKYGGLSEDDGHHWSCPWTTSLAKIKATEGGE